MNTPKASVVARADHLARHARLSGLPGAPCPVARGDEAEPQRQTETGEHAEQGKPTPLATAT